MEKQKNDEETEEEEKHKLHSASEIAEEEESSKSSKSSKSFTSPKTPHSSKSRSSKSFKSIKSLKSLEAEEQESLSKKEACESNILSSEEKEEIKWENSSSSSTEYLNLPSHSPPKFTSTKPRSLFKLKTQQLPIQSHLLLQPKSKSKHQRTQSLTVPAQPSLGPQISTDSPQPAINPIVMKVVKQGLINKVWNSGTVLGLQDSEIILYRVISFALLTVIIFVALVYYNYLLLGEFFTTIFMAFMCSLALRPSKDTLIVLIKTHITGEAPACVTNSFLARILMFIIRLFDKKRKKKTHIIIRGFRKLVKWMFYDVYLLLFICFVYICYKKGSGPFTLIILLIICFFELYLRLIVDIIYIICRKVVGKKFLLDENDEPLPYIHSTVSIILIIGSILVVLLVGGLIYIFLLTDLTEMGKGMGYFFSGYIQQLLSLNVEDETMDEWIRVATKSYGHIVQEGLNITLNISKITQGNHADIVHELLSGTRQVLNSSIILKEFNLSQSLFGEIFPDEIEDTNIEVDASYSDIFNFTAIFYNAQNVIPYLQENSNQLFSLIMTLLSRVYYFLLSIVAIFAGTFITSLINVSMGIFNFLFITILFFSTIFTLLSFDGHIIKRGFSILPLQVTVRERIENSLVKAIEGVFLSSFKIFIYHFIYTWLIYDIFRIKYSYLYTIVAGLITLLPVMDCTWLSILSSLILYYNSGLFIALLFFTVYSGVISFVDRLIYKKTTNAHPYMLGTSVFLGMYAFGVQGVIFGPSLVCISVVLYDFYSSNFYKVPITKRVFSSKTLDRLDNI